MLSYPSTRARSPPASEQANSQACTQTKHSNITEERNLKMKILFINNSGGGYADYIQVQEPMTIDQLFKDKMSNESPDNFLIRVNRMPVPKDYVLQDNDRVTFTPTKIDGAAC